MSYWDFTPSGTPSGIMRFDDQIQILNKAKEFYEDQGIDEFTIRKCIRKSHEQFYYLRIDAIDEDGTMHYSLKRLKI